MIKTKKKMSVVDAIYSRRAVRDFAPDVIDQTTVEALIDAAIQAPTAMYQEPWAFAVIQNLETLDMLSTDAKELLIQDYSHIPEEHKERLLARANDPENNLFYNANTLIVIYGKPMGDFVAADCWLAAENMMLAAHGMGLGSCVIGLAISALNLPQWRAELNVADNMTAYAAVILGVPAGETPSRPRKNPEILSWKK